jgi:hypothetical protein
MPVSFEDFKELFCYHKNTNRLKHHKEEFNRRESKLYAYMRGNENENDFHGSVQGLGTIQSFSGNNITFFYSAEMVNIGNPVYQVNGDTPQNIGTITAINDNVITIQPTGITPIVGSFCYEKRNGRVDGGDIRGYYMEVVLSNDSTHPVELFAIGSNVIKSHP